MKKRLLYLVIGLAVLTAASFLMGACDSDDDKNEKNARIEVRLTDAPGNYEEVNIDIQGVEIHTEDGEPSEGWMALDVEPGVYNLLDLTNGLDTLIGSLELPAGRVSQLRLILGDNNTLLEDGEVKHLETPSAQQSGLKLNINADLQEGVTYTVLLDFDVARSIVTTGSGSYILKPVIRVITEATSGAIKGSLSIPESTPAVYAILNLDTLGTTYADTTGNFMLRGLPAGSYTVSFAPDSGYSIVDTTGVVVTIGNVTDLGVVNVQ